MLSTYTQAPLKRNLEEEAAKLEASWQNERWRETARPYTAKDVIALRGSIEQTCAHLHRTDTSFATMRIL